MLYFRKVFFFQSNLGFSEELIWDYVKNLIGSPGRGALTKLRSREGRQDMGKGNGWGRGYVVIYVGLKMLNLNLI